jgi:DNA-binding CsgD family transcriptional regulator/PAS domain-containing protein
MSRSLPTKRPIPSRHPETAGHAAPALVPADDEERLSALIGDIYDAALAPSRWRSVLRATSAFVGGSAAALYAKDATSKSGGVFFDDGGISPRYTRLYFEKYIKLDPSTTAHFFAELEEPVATADIMSYAEFLETRFYREWARPQQLVDHVTAVLDKSTTSVALFGVFRHERHGLVDDETRKRMRLIVPHIRRAVLIGKAIDLKTAEAATFAEVIDGLRAGMFLVDREGKIVHANVAGHAMLAKADLLHVAGTRLSARDPEMDQALRATFFAASAGDLSLGARGIALPLRGLGGERYVAHVLPLTGGKRRRRTGVAHAATAALFVHKAAVEAPSPPEIIAKTFRLTPTELRVFLAIVEVGGVPEVSEALGVGETTVKTHLGRIFEKTGATRQADLVKLFAGFSNALLD